MKQELIQQAAQSVLEALEIEIHKLTSVLEVIGRKEWVDHFEGLEQIIKLNTDLSEHEIIIVVSMIFNICKLEYYSDLKAENMIADLLRIDDDKYDIEKIELISKVISSSLDNYLDILFKGIQLIYDRDNVMQSSDVIVDIRPVFDKSAKTILAQTLLISLKLRKMNSGGSEKLSDLTYALSETDLDDLADKIKRAKTKLELIKSKNKKERIIPSI